MGLLFSNNATALLAVGLAPGDTVISITPGAGALFPTVAGASADYFVVTLEDSSGNREFVKVKLRSADNFGDVTYPCTRAFYGSSARTWAVGDLCDLRWNAGNADEITTIAEAAEAAASSFDPIRTTIALG